MNERLGSSLMKKRQEYESKKAQRLTAEAKAKSDALLPRFVPPPVPRHFQLVPSAAAEQESKERAEKEAAKKAEIEAAQLSQLRQEEHFENLQLNPGYVEAIANELEGICIHIVYFHLKITPVFN